MKRRDLLQIAGLAGLAVLAPLTIQRRARAASKYAGPYFVALHAGGGWDPTMLTDPKGGTINKTFTAGATAGNLTYAPIDYKDDDTGKVAYSAKAFFDAYKDRLLVLNGIDTTTNNHDTGTRITWSGASTEGQPALAAMFAAQQTKDAPIPMAFLSNGGFDATEGVVQLTRSGSIDALRRIAYPNVANVGDVGSDKPISTFVTPDTQRRIADAQAARLTSMRDAARLPVQAEAMSALYLARQSNDGLDLLANVLAGQKQVKVEDFPDLKDIGGLGALQSLMQQAQLAVSAFTAGVAVSANLTIGGFDTHSNHDDDQGRQLMQLLRGLAYLYSTADAAGIGGNLYVMVGSDFGRTPKYNTANGKDHWNVTSMMLSGPGIAGNRVLGQTTPGFGLLSYDQGLNPVDNGRHLEPRHIHRALRDRLGMGGGDVDKRFPVAGGDIAVPLG
ncbi:MAG: DUF1501 domain-containing protein [Polyangiaceae bacterium]|nr:DUF1501 domain-containing protein [Polyangiaceae bacterium]